jgi:hypothetical protein
MRMARQNRVTPFGDIIATPERGAIMGNRGVLHDSGGRIRRAWQLKRWIVCVLEFRGRKRQVMTPGRCTELFFLDEATALAAGYRPCIDRGGDLCRLRPRGPSVRRGSGVRGVMEMLPLYRDPHFTFRFGEDRIIPRFHLEGVGAGRRVSVFKIDPGTSERLGLLATATAGEGGWVDLAEPIIVRAGEGFIVVSDPE